MLPLPPSNQSQPPSADVLLVDDDRFCLVAGAAAVKRLGFSVVAVEDGEDAVDLIVGRRGSFRLVLIDKNMARLDGIQTVQRLVKHFAEIKREKQETSGNNPSGGGQVVPLIVGCTGDAVKDSHDAFLTAGADKDKSALAKIDKAVPAVEVTTSPNFPAERTTILFCICHHVNARRDSMKWSLFASLFCIACVAVSGLQLHGLSDNAETECDESIYRAARAILDLPPAAKPFKKKGDGTISNIDNLVAILHGSRETPFFPKYGALKTYRPTEQLPNSLIELHACELLLSGYQGHPSLTRKQYQPLNSHKRQLRRSLEKFLAVEQPGCLTKQHGGNVAEGEGASPELTLVKEEESRGVDEEESLGVETGEEEEEGGGEEEEKDYEDALTEEEQIVSTPPSPRVQKETVESSTAEIEKLGQALEEELNLGCTRVAVAQLILLRPAFNGGVFDFPNGILPFSFALKFIFALKEIDTHNLDHSGLQAATKVEALCLPVQSPFIVTGTSVPSRHFKASEASEACRDAMESLASHQTFVDSVTKLFMTSCKGHTVHQGEVEDSFNLDERDYGFASREELDLGCNARMTSDLVDMYREFKQPIRPGSIQMTVQYSFALKFIFAIEAGPLGDAYRSLRSGKAAPLGNDGEGWLWAVLAADSACIPVYSRFIFSGTATKKRDDWEPIPQGCVHAMQNLQTFGEQIEGALKSFVLQCGEAPLCTDLGLPSKMTDNRDNVNPYHRA
uniref:Response regulatory domain-containing protein n=1 Tax=Chromera velia CCMP2878 TaxID=1169474 RepID=A0A0G4HPP1_9ALVE|eukprot:Cvel_7807.t1-p1 / transcript=Cvel_7807.t1 / gene=Cvel_7807 / organism=Chromera_velia_CCMP2878 / gene_product=hypothetical protein / transcript_product=hypothetical protein / location=Cvel_scaffold416:85227-90690(-) / protein_length=734 / sequence_SO=supercontig / SO=protein_coding / is_pseudo=false